MGIFTIFSKIEIVAPQQPSSAERLAEIIQNLYEQNHVTLDKIAAATALGYSPVSVTNVPRTVSDGDALIRMATAHVRLPCASSEYSNVAEKGFVISHYLRGAPVQCQFGDIIPPVRIRIQNPRSVHQIAKEYERALTQPAPPKGSRLRVVPREP